LGLARFLIGKLLVRERDGVQLVGRIVETEAYTPGDPASHAYRGETKRNGAMYLDPGRAYVYLIYGTAYCMNVTTEVAGVGAAVLIRALEPVAGVDTLRANRVGIADRDLARGPGRLCMALDIGPDQNGIALDPGGPLWIARDRRPVLEIGESTRIGLTKAADVPHRFYARGSRFVSGPRVLSP